MSGFEVEARTELEPWARDALDQQDKVPETTAESVAGQEAAPAPHEGGITPDQAAMLDRMDILQPGDFKAVASLLEMHPELCDEILARAQQVCGNDTVARALELIQGQGAAPEAAEAETEVPNAEAAVDEAAATNQPGAEAKPVEEFVYIVSPLALEYDRAEKVKDHVEYIRNHPELRDTILIQAAEFDPQLVEEVRAALERAAPAETAAVEAPTADAPAPDPAAQVEAFEYILSPLALEYARDQKIVDHVDFIRNNPGMRDAVLSGAAEFDPQLAEDVRVALEQGMTPQPAGETEHTPPEVVQEAAEQAAPTPVAEGRAPEPEPTVEAEPGWVTRARAYHRNHEAYAAQFNELTNGECMGPSGELDPNLVANWQVAHGIAPDGRVGADTVAEAVQSVPLTYADAVEMAAAAGEPPPDVTDPQFLM